MASKVNVKFVVLLVGSLVAVLAIAAGLYIGVVRKSADDLIRMGDEQMAQGAYSQAVASYGRAVRREQNNAEYLRKWIGAMEELIPPTETAFQNEFVKYLAAKSALANALGTDVQAHSDYLGMLWAMVEEAPYQRGRIDQLVSETTQATRFFGGGTPGPNDDWASLLLYRGAAHVRTLREGADLSREDLNQARSDLEAVLAHDPNNREAALQLGLFHAGSGVVAMREDRQTDHLASLNAAREHYDAFLDRQPGDPFILTDRLLLQIDRIAYDVRQSGETDRGVHFEMFEARFPPLRDELVRIAAALRDHPDTDHHDATRFYEAERRLEGDNRGSLTVEILQAILDRDPNDALAVMWLGQTLMTERQWEDAAEAMRVVSPMREEPVRLSLRGNLYQGAIKIATYVEARAVMRLASEVRFQLAPESGQVISPEVRAELEAQLEQHLARAAEVQAVFGQITSPDDPRVRRLEAERLYTAREYEQAQGLLRQYNEQVLYGDPETLWWAGQTAVRLQQFGRAREAFERAREVAPDQAYITVALGELEVRMNEHERALELFESVLDSDPTNELASLQATRLRQVLGLVAVDDPVRQVILDAARLVRGTSAGPGDPSEAAVLIIERLDSLNYAPAAAREAAKYLVDLDRIAEAAEILNEALERHPDDASLAQIAGILSNPDTVEAKLQLIELADLTPAARTLAKYQLLARAGRNEQAAAMLDDAIAAAPENPNVIEAAFLRALQMQQFDEAQRWSERAEAANADQVNGATFEARLLFARGDTEASIALLESVTSAEVVPASAFVLLGVQQLTLREPLLAARSFSQSLEIRPNQPTVIVQYVRALAASNQFERARDEARRLQRQGSGSSEFVNLWLDLEAEYGDAALALERREERQLRDPTDRRNREALARLYIDTDPPRWQAAEGLILGLREEEDSLALVRLNADYFASQGQIDAARSVYYDHITTLDETEDRDEFVLSHIELARFLFSRGDFGGSIQAIDRIRAYQDAATLPADQLLAEILQTGEDYESALEVLQGIIAAGADDEDQGTQKRAIDTMIRLQRFEEARATLDRVAGADTRDPVYLIQRAEIAKLNSEFEPARRDLDRAIAIAPESALGYIKRAELLLAQFVQSDDEVVRQAFVADALADLDEAIRLQADNWVARQLRAQMYFTVGRIDDAVGEFRAALQLQPSQEVLRQRLMIELLGLGRVEDAVFLAVDAARSRPGDLPLVVRLSGVFRQRGLWSEAGEVIRLGWEASRDVNFGAFYVDALLNQDPPDVEAARDVLGMLRNLDAPVNESPALLVLQGVILAKSGRSTDAEEMMVRAFAACDPENQTHFDVWYRNIDRVFPDNPGERVRLIDAAMERVGRTSPAGEWGQMLMTWALLSFEPRKSEGIERMRELARDGSNPGRSIRSWIMLGASQLETDPEGAVADWRRGLEMHNDEWTLLNNVAFTLAERLDRLEEALPIAQDAADNAPEGASSDALDTLGFIHYRIGQSEQNPDLQAESFRQAEEKLDEAAGQTNQLLTAAQILYHQTLVAVARGDTEQARVRAERFVRQVQHAPTLAEQFTDELDELRSLLDRS